MRRFDHGQTDSTSERALAALAEGTALDGDVHVARSQSAGRGRLGRSWHSPAGTGLYLSWVHMPPTAPPPAALSVAAGLALLDCVTRLGLVGASLEWPNDLLVEHAKLAGVLVETRGLDPARPAYVLGVGLNVGQLEFPRDLTDERRVTSLVRQGLAVELAEVERHLVMSIAARLSQIPGGLARLGQDYARACGLVGGLVEAVSAGDALRGELLEFDVVRGLTVRPASGEAIRIPLELLTRLDSIR